jgi:hypothetical protein
LRFANGAAQGRANLPRGLGIPTGANPADVDQSGRFAPREAKLEHPAEPSGTNPTTTKRSRFQHFTLIQASRRPDG